MGHIYSVFCDESCHLENDPINKAMTLGAIWCKGDSVKRIADNLKSIKKKHHLASTFEIKWTKVSPAKKDFYIDLVTYFFDEQDLHFRTIIIPDKSKLNHMIFNQTHDDWYYKMYFLLLKEVLDPKSKYDIYIDIKDTRGYAKQNKLRNVLCNSNYDFDNRIINKIQQLRSHEVIILQLTDLLVGAISYLHRNLSTSNSKRELIELIQKRSGHDLMRSTLPKENKFNIFVWSPKEC